MHRNVLSASAKPKLDVNMAWPWLRLKPPSLPRFGQLLQRPQVPALAPVQAPPPVQAPTRADLAAAQAPRHPQPQPRVAVLTQVVALVLLRLDSSATEASDSCRLPQHFHPVRKLPSVAPWPPREQRAVRCVQQVQHAWQLLQAPLPLRLPPDRQHPPPPRTCGLCNWGTPRILTGEPTSVALLPCM